MWNGSVVGMDAIKVSKQTLNCCLTHLLSWDNNDPALCALSTHTFITLLFLTLSFPLGSPSRLSLVPYWQSAQGWQTGSRAWGLIKCSIRSQIFWIRWMALTEKIQRGGLDSHDLRGHTARAHAYTKTHSFKLSGNEAITSRCCLLFTPQINLQRRMRVTGLITQGAKRIGSAEYVKSYKVAYSDDGKSWRTYKVKGKDDDMVRHTQGPTNTAHTHPLTSRHSFSLASHRAIHRRRYTHAHTRARSHTATRDCALSQGQGGGHDEMAF